jgi:acyl-CoA dehydrogenase
MLDRKIFTEEHEMFRDSVKRFMETEIAPYHLQWEKQGQLSREAWRKAGEAGLLCTAMPEEYGGAGADFRFAAVAMEEQGRIGATGPGFYLHSDIVAPYILHFGGEDQKKQWLPPMASGEVITAIAMSEPAAGSDLQGIKTRAVKDRDGYILNGSKIFITNGQLADMVIVVAKTDPALGAKGISLFLVETWRDGFTKGRNLDKIGMKAQDTSELFFDDLRLPKENLLGQENQGFIYLMRELPQERLIVAIMGIAAAEGALGWTIEYTKERQVFKQPVLEFQNTRFSLAELQTEVQVGRVFTDRCIEAHLEGKLDARTASMVKLWVTEMQCRVIDACLQLHGGYGYMWEYPIARAWADARAQRIYAGTNEVMKELISRGL